MYLTATGDPGILPRSPEVPDEILRNPAHPRERIVYVGETPITTKYCGTLWNWWGALLSMLACLLDTLVLDSFSACVLTLPLCAFH